MVGLDGPAPCHGRVTIGSLPLLRANEGLTMRSTVLATMTAPIAPAGAGCRGWEYSSGMSLIGPLPLSRDGLADCGNDHGGGWFTPAGAWAGALPTVRSGGP